VDDDDDDDIITPLNAVISVCGLPAAEETTFVRYSTRARASEIQRPWRWGAVAPPGAEAAAHRHGLREISRERKKESTVEPANFGSSRR
jgi:hypothetical protein